MCSEEALLSFDPGSLVAERRLLPVASQALGGSKQQIVEVRCRDGEADEDCAARSEARARDRFPTATIDTSVLHRRHLLHSRFKVDGVETRRDFADTQELASHLDSLRKAGKQVRLSSARFRPAPGSPRHALSRATLPGRVKHHKVLRLELRIQPSGGSSLSAMLRANKRIASHGWQLHSWQTEAGGSFRMEIGCTTPAPPAL